MDIVLVQSYSDKPWRSPETYQLIEKALSEKWRVHRVSANTASELKRQFDLIADKWGSECFVFNIAEYLDETHKTGFIPGLLDEWNFSHLGSRANVCKTGLDKEKTKQVLVNSQIPTPRFFVQQADEKNQHFLDDIGYPLFIKPLYEGGHIGIGDHSIVEDYESFQTETKRIIKNFNEPALVEEYIGGDEMREFSVGIIDAEERLFTPIEIDYEVMNFKTPILSHEAAIHDLERIKLIDDEKARDILTNLAFRTFQAIGAQDYCRVDIRMNQKGFFVLEINVMPGMGPQSFIPEAAQKIYGIHYAELIQKIVEGSIKRKIPKNN